MIDSIIQGYEDTKLVHHNDMGDDFPNTVDYEDLPNAEVHGVVKSVRRVGDRLKITFSQQESHIGVVAATRTGKTTSVVIPTSIIISRLKEKRSLFFSDPKGELYRVLAKVLEEAGYKVILINLRDYIHSECINLLHDIYVAYIRAYNLEDEVEVVKTPDGLRNRFMGKIYEDQNLLDEKIEQMKKILMEDVGNEIDNLALRTISTEKTNDPYWEDSARELLKAGIWAMLEDTHPADGVDPITEETFSFRTLLSIFDSMQDGSGTYYDDNGYFTSRPHTSKAYTLAKNCIIENAVNTRKCLVSTFNTKMAPYKSSAVRLITSCNSFDFSDLTNEEQPVAVFISYKDELKAHYNIISSFVQSAYNYLIQYANNKPTGKLNVPFYFILDEFGNFPAIPDFDTVISACGGRNIFFMLILQSYAQLNNVYGQNVAEIIRDNLNIHMFLGSNNPQTLEEFSRECGEYTRVAPISALNGSSSEIDNYHIETIPLVPKSMLSKLKVGECIVSEANCGYVMFSKMERYYLCKEFNSLPQADARDYHGAVDPLDDKFIYEFKPRKKEKQSRFDW